MNTCCQSIPNRRRLWFFPVFKSLLAWVVGLTMQAGVPAASSAADSDAAPKIQEAPPPSRIHALFNLEVSSSYLTPRGLIVEDQGVVFQPLFLMFVNLWQGDDFINEVTLVPGVWNSIHSRKAGPDASHWNEIDPILGLNTKFAKDFTLGITYTIFKSENGSFATSHHLETKLSYDDTKYLKAFALHPYIIYWQELKNKATPARTGPGYYFDVGITPAYTIGRWDLKLEAPIRALFPNERFYGAASTVGLYELGLKGTIPLKFMPKGGGDWSAHAGFKYMRFLNDNLIGFQSFLGPGRPTKDAAQFYFGISAFF